MFINSNNLSSYVMPNIPSLFALLRDLNSKINHTTTPVYPKKGKHTPVPDGDFNDAFTFGHHAFPALATRTDAEKWSLTTPGLEFACEADAKLNEAFAERYDNFDFPATNANDVTSLIAVFLSMETRSDWFNQVKDVAAAAALYFEGSGTLADCSPIGIVSNQIQVAYPPPATAPAPATRFFDPASRFPLSYQMFTTSRNLPALAEPLAAMAQTHVRFPSNHPFLSNIGTAGTRTGKFWEIRPIERSTIDDDSYLALQGLVKKMMKSRV